MFPFFYPLFSLFALAGSIPFEEFEPAWKSHLVKNGFGRMNFSRASDYPTTIQGYGNSYTIPNVQYLSGPPTTYSATLAPPLNPAGAGYLTLIPGSMIDSDVKCGGDNRNFCNYPELPFIETLNIPNVLAGPNRLNRLPSGRCPEGYSKLPTMDCLNIAAAFIETTCCVYNAPPVTLTDYCSNRQGLLFSATFELCDGRNFMVSGSNAWQVDDTFRIIGGPYSLSTLTGGTVSSGVDSALVDSSCNVGFFVGTALKWMNFPGKTASTDQTLAALLGTIPTNLCGGLSCVPTLVNFAVCPNNGFCMVSVSLLASSGTVYKQLFFLAPGFNSFIAAGTTPPGIAVLNQFALATNFRNYMAATFIRSTSQIAFIDTSNNVYYYDTVGKLISGPTNLFDLFGVCGGVGATGNGYTIYIPYPIYGAPPNASLNYGAAPAYQAPPSPDLYGPSAQQSVEYAPPPVPPGYDAPYTPQAAPQQYPAPPTAPPQYNQPYPTPVAYKSSSDQQYQAPPQPQYQAPPQPQYQAPPQPQYQAPPQPQYQAPPQPQYQAPSQPQYQAPPQPQYQATPAPSYQPQPQAVQYQPMPATPQPPQYQPPLELQYQAPPQIQYQAPPTTPPPQQYQAPMYQSPSPQYVPSATPAPAVYRAPYKQPAYTQPTPVPPSPVINKDQQTVVLTPSQPPATASQPQTSNLLDAQRVQEQTLAPVPSQFPPQGPPIRKRTQTSHPINLTLADPSDNTVFRAPFKAPGNEFFDVSAFVRKGDIERFQPSRELKLV